MQTQNVKALIINGCHMGAVPALRLTLVVWGKSICSLGPKADVLATVEILRSMFYLGRPAGPPFQIPRGGRGGGVTSGVP